MNAATPPGVPDWRDRARALADDLDAAVTLDSAWREAFEEVPRHVFVPWFYRDGDFAVISGTDPDQREQWLRAVYSDDSLITQLAPVPGSDLRWATSSSTMPSLMARMLALLDVTEGQSALEVGTGTGYNAALLCHRLGDQHVTSIDLDPALIAEAATRLDRLGWHPHLIAGNGAAGVPDRVPYDRIIATCGVSAVPPAWLDQLAPGGRILADFNGNLTSNLIVLRSSAQHTVLTGRFLPDSGYFMPLRPRIDNPLRDGGTRRTTFDTGNPDQRATDLDPARLDSPDLAFLLQFHIPDLEFFIPDTDDKGARAFYADDGSWAKITPTDHGHHVRQGGPRRLWDLAENAVNHWDDLGQPAPARYGLTITSDGTHYYWLDTPDTPVWTSRPQN